MTGTTHANFGADTEAVEVAKAFPQSVHGKTILVTGVNQAGIGFAVVEAFASQSPATLILAGRKPQKLNDCIEVLQKSYANVAYRALELDLSKQKAVRASVRELLSWEDIPTIDIVVNNAGVMNLPERELTEEGIEMTFATNHIGHFLFVSLIMPKLLEAARNNSKGSTRIINMSALLAPGSSIRWSDLTFEKTTKELPPVERPDPATHAMWGVTDLDDRSYLPLQAYLQTKIANVLFSIALNERTYAKYGILSFATHPGIILTELGRYYPPELRKALEGMLEKGLLPLKTLGAGAATAVTAALDPKLDLPAMRETDGLENYGVYFKDCQISDHTPPGTCSSSEAEKLWTVSEEMVKEKFAW